MSKETQSLVMVLLGGIVVSISTTDVYLRYVKEGFRPFLLAAGVILIAVGFLTLVGDVRRRWAERGGRHRAGRALPDAPSAACCDTTQDVAGPKSAWLLIAPALVVLLAAHPTLGSYAADRTGSATALAKNQVERAPGTNATGASGKTSIYPPLPASDPDGTVRVTFIDYVARAVFDDGTSLRGRDIRLVGFVSEGPGKTVYLSRMIMVCCAADSRPLKVGLTGRLGVADQAEPDEWIEITGEYTSKQDTDDLNSEKIPYITVTSARAVPAPTNPYDSL